jgi:hypothetical protein
MKALARLLSPLVRHAVTTPARSLDPDSAARPVVPPLARPGQVERAEREAGRAETHARTGPDALAPSSRHARHDLADIRIHTDARAAVSARLLHADAYTFGPHIVFAPGRYAPNDREGRALLAHELTHVAQQRQAPGPPTIQRRVAASYAAVEDRLSYGLIDWAITDEDARAVLEVLATLSETDLADTVTAMDRDGLVERLLDNVSEEDRERHAVLIGKITRRRSAARSAERIVDLLSRGIFDWAVTDTDARDALHALMGLESQQLRTVVGRMVNARVFDTLLEELPDEEHRRFAAFIRRLRAIRDEFLALIRAHGAFLAAQPGGAAETVWRRIRETGYGGSSSDWDRLSPAQQRAWRTRAEDAVAAVTASLRGHPELGPILARSELVFVPEEVDRAEAYAYVRGENELYFGREWVVDVEEDPRNVWQSIAHELGGHEEFGTTWSWQIMSATLEGMSAEERRVALSGRNFPYSAYGYLETEIYAELRELPYRLETSGGDRPETRVSERGEVKPGDVRKQLRRIRDAFGPDVGGQIVIRLYYRVLDDPRITPEAKRLLYEEVQHVFGLFPLRTRVAP